MNLRYISLHTDFNSGVSDDFKKRFNLRTRFISNFFSVQIRKIKFKTDGTYNMIAIVPTLKADSACSIVPDATLMARVELDLLLYESLSEEEKTDYCLKLLANGFIVCKKHRDTPFDELINLAEVFRSCGYKNEWVHKEKKFALYDLSVKLECYFTSNDFKLVISAKQISTGENILYGTLLKTPPDEIFFEDEFKDILIEDGSVIITERHGRVRFKALLDDVYKGQMNFYSQEY